MLPKITFILAFIYLPALAATNTKLIPAFADHVSGKNGSVWQSELRLYNSSQATQVLHLQKAFMSRDVSCTGFGDIVLAPGALAQIRSFGCPTGAAAALEVSADDSVVMSSVITNVGSAPQDSCCLTGYAQNIPILQTSSAYSLTHTLANLQIPVILHGVQFGTNLGRHNFIFVNPNDTATTVTLRYFDASGVLQPAPPFPYSSATIPANGYLQLNDIFPQPSFQFEGPALAGWFRVEASATAPFYVFDSYVDNSTNDATTIESR